ncbi:MAG: type II secretion system F family protein [Pyrobaculum sp.]
MASITRWLLRGIENTDLDPLRFKYTARLFNLLSIAVVGVGAFLTLTGAFPLGPLVLGIGAFLFFFPKFTISLRAGSIRELLKTEMVFFTALIQMAFATKAHLNLVVERMTRYKELPGVRTLAIAAWNNARMLGMEPFDAIKSAVEKLAPQKLRYRFNSLYTALRIGEDVVAKLSLYMDMDIVEFSSAMQRRLDRLTSLISSLVVGLAMLSVTAVVIGRGNPAMLILMGGLMPAVLGVVMSLVINVPLMKMEFKILPLAFGVAAAIALITAGFTPMATYAPLLALGVALAGWVITRERTDAKAFERGFSDFIYTVFDELKRAPSVYRAVENAITFGNYGPFNKTAAAVLQAMKIGDSRLEDVSLKGLQPVMSVVLRMLFDIYRLGTLPRATVDQLQNFIVKLFEFRAEIGRTLNITRFLALAGAAMVAFVNTSMIRLTEALSKISGGAQLGGVGMGMLYLALGIMSIGYYLLFAKISFSTRGGLLYLGLLYLAIFFASLASGLMLV